MEDSLRVKDVKLVHSEKQLRARDAELAELRVELTGAKDKVSELALQVRSNIFIEFEVCHSDTSCVNYSMV